MWYNLDHEPISLDEAEELILDFNSRRIAITVGRAATIVIATFFTVIDRRKPADGGPPLLYQTGIFGGPCDWEFGCYATRAEALVGHRKAAALFGLTVE